MSDQKQRDAEADLASVAQKCHRCGGDGRLQNDEVCKECLGTGAEYPEALREIAVWWIAEALRMRTVLASIEEYGTEEINTAFELRTALARARAELTRQQVANEDLRAEVARLKQELGDTLVRSHNETAIIRGQLLQPSAVARLETWAKKHGGWFKVRRFWVALEPQPGSTPFSDLVAFRCPSERNDYRGSWHPNTTTMTVGTDEKPATLDAMILAVLAKWEELYGDK